MSMRDFWRKYGGLMLTILISSFLCLYLYQNDNKYQSNATQAANGTLVLSEQDLAENPLRFLTQGWAFYPDKLYTPETFLMEAPTAYMNYVSIGENTRFDHNGTRENPHGSGTYSMRLVLPPEVKTYALELPEIFSAYRLYVDDKLVLQMGNPDPERYQPLTQTRMVTFEKGGAVTLLLAVTDYSHYYSGMVYPPAFGTPYSLNTSREWRLMICMIIDTIVLIAALLSLYFGLRLKQKNALIFAVLCLAACGFTSYGLIHMTLELPVFPWYGLELACGYLVTLLVITLHNRICGTGQTASFVSNTVAVLFCILSLCYGLFSSMLTAPVVQAFSALTFCFKTGAAAYLLVTAYLSRKANNPASEPIFFAAVAYAVAFVWDRILPAFEPIICGWFLEWGSLLFVCAIGYTLWRDMARGYAYGLAFAEENRQVTRQLAMQMAYARQIAQQSEQNRRLTHDFRQHLRAIGGIAAKHEQKELLDYIEQIGQIFQTARQSQIFSFSKNTAVDALLGFYYSVAIERQIKTDFRLLLPEQFPLTDVELCTVIGNLIENAVEACERQTEGEKIILLSTCPRKTVLFLLVENTYNGIYENRSGVFLSQKSASVRYGVGLQSVRKILQKYDGTLDIFPEKGRFRVGITIPLCENGESGAEQGNQCHF